MRLRQLLNAYSPIVVTVAGISTTDMDVPSNAQLPIVTNPSFKVTLLIFTHPEKALLAIVVTLHPFISAGITSSILAFSFALSIPWIVIVPS